MDFFVFDFSIRLRLLQGATSWHYTIVDLSSQYVIIIHHRTKVCSSEHFFIPFWETQQWDELYIRTEVTIFLMNFPYINWSFPRYTNNVTQARIPPFAKLHCGMYGSCTRRCNNFTYFIYFTYYSQVVWPSQKNSDLLMFEPSYLSCDTRDDYDNSDVMTNCLHLKHSNA